MGLELFDSVDKLSYQLTSPPAPSIDNGLGSLARHFKFSLCCDAEKSC